MRSFPFPQDISRQIVLGFDFGTRRIGVAIGQGITQTARPLKPILVREAGIPWLEVQRLIKEWGPTSLLVGIPLNMDGSEQAITALAREFAEELHHRFNLPIYEVDERLTTKEAKAQIFEQYGYKGLVGSSVDSYAAKLIIETWFSQ